MPGARRSFVQFGAWSLGLCAIVAIPVFATARSPVTFVIALALIPCAIMLLTLTIACDDQGVSWFFTAGLFRKRLAYHEIASCEPAAFVPLSFGYRIGPNRRAWIASGRKGITVSEVTSEMRYLVGCDDPDAVCAEVRRRMDARR